MRQFTEQEKTALIEVKKAIGKLVNDKVVEAKAKGITPDLSVIEMECEEQFFDEFQHQIELASENTVQFLNQLKADEPVLFEKIRKDFSIKVPKVEQGCPVPFNEDDLSIGDPHPLTSEEVQHFYQRGLDWFDQEDYDKAFLYFSFLTFNRPDDPEMWFVKGMAEQNLLRFDEALISYGRTISLNPQSLLPYIHIIDTLILAQELDKAKEFYEGFIREVKPEDYADNPIVRAKLKTIDDYLKNPILK